MDTWVSVKGDLQWHIVAFLPPKSKRDLLALRENSEAGIGTAPPAGLASVCSKCAEEKASQKWVWYFHLVSLQWCTSWHQTHNRTWRPSFFPSFPPSTLPYFPDSLLPKVRSKDPSGEPFICVILQCIPNPRVRSLSNYLRQHLHTQWLLSSPLTGDMRGR